MGSGKPPGDGAPLRGHPHRPGHHAPRSLYQLPEVRAAVERVSATSLVGLLALGLFIRLLLYYGNIPGQHGQVCQLEGICQELGVTQSYQSLQTRVTE